MAPLRMHRNEIDTAAVRRQSHRCQSKLSWHPFRLNMNRRVGVKAIARQPNLHKGLSA
jgi:hypothetical protein